MYQCINFHENLKNCNIKQIIPGKEELEARLHGQAVTSTDVEYTPHNNRLHQVTVKRKVEDRTEGKCFFNCIVY